MSKKDIPIIYGSIGHYEDIDMRNVIDLNGPDGNAFYLIGLAIKTAKRRGLDSDKIAAEMKEGDYENLLRVFESYFSTDFILVR